MLFIPDRARRAMITSAHAIRAVRASAREDPDTPERRTDARPLDPP
jgi:hypothetical protein